MPLSPSVLARLQYQHQTIDELIAGMNEEELKHRVNPDKWSVFENMVHLAAYQPVFIQRIHLILNEHEPLFERYVAENDPVFHQYLQKSLKGLSDDISSARLSIVNSLKQLNEQQLNRSGRHKAYGLIRLSEWADFFLLHEAHHLWTI